MVLIYSFKKILKLIIHSVGLWVCVAAGAQDLQEIQIANEYLLKGEKEKALEAYQQLARSQVNISSIHSNYFNLLIDLKKFKQAENYTERVIKSEKKFSYQIDLGILYLKENNKEKAENYFSNLFKTNAEDVYRLKWAADYLTSYNLLDYATDALLQARESGGKAVFSLELANLYRLQNKRDEMVSVYLDYIIQMPSNVSYIKNLLQQLLSKPEDLDAFERVLYDRVQQNQDSEVYADLLIWVNLQQKNFYGAFVQARAYDKRFKKPQSKTLEIGQIAMNNKDYENAIKCFSFVIKEFPNGENNLSARFGVIQARETKVKKTFPVNIDSIRYIVGEYKNFEKKFSDQPMATDAQLSESMLDAYFLNELDSAVTVLSKVISNPRVSLQQKSQAKINLGDIYVLKDEPWESTLLYSQVEKTQHESALGYEAKLRNAKLWYYRGDFKLAQEHLDILKQATTREIANDAMDLSMRIKENTTYDTAGIALKEFSAIELLVNQNHLNEAIKKLESFDAKTSPQILDDVYWLQANLLLKQGKFLEAIMVLQKILNEFNEDILADDAYFLQGDIYENQLTNKTKAMEIYREFLNKFPGSVYAAEARKRYRILRGDFSEAPNQ